MGAAEERQFFTVMSLSRTKAEKVRLLVLLQPRTSDSSPCLQLFPPPQNVATVAEKVVARREASTRLPLLPVPRLSPAEIKQIALGLLDNPTVKDRVPTVTPMHTSYPSSPC